jgi:tripartite-type tricarboxylate transporter receptor subunit TctC
VAIATGPMTGAADLKQLMEWQRAQKDAVFASAPGNGSLSHFVGISTSLATKVPMTHVPYKDSGVGIIDLAASRLPMLITGLQPMIEMHKAGRIRLLAVSGDVRSPLVPEVPTLKEAGVDIVSSTYTGVFGPPNMSPDLTKRLHDAIAPMLANAQMKEKLAQLTMTTWPATGAEVSALLVEERKRFEQLVKASGYQKEDA